MSKQRIIILILTVILELALLFSVVNAFTKGKTLEIFFGCLIWLAFNIWLFKLEYYSIIDITKNLRLWCKPLSIEELKYVEEAKELIKKVDENIVLYNFNVYSLRIGDEAWYIYNSYTQEANIFIPFEHSNKDFCFSVVIHEILHSQNLKTNQSIFKREFLEGLNQLLTIWLINTYSDKYFVPENSVFVFQLKDKTEELVITYFEEVKMVREIIQKSNLDLKEVFLKYINFEPEYFRSFVPAKYFLN